MKELLPATVSTRDTVAMAGTLPHAFLEKSDFFKQKRPQKAVDSEVLKGLCLILKYMEKFDP